MCIRKFCLTSGSLSVDSEHKLVKKGTAQASNPSVKPTLNERRKTKLLGHFLRASQDDLMSQISFQTDTAYRVEYGKTRVGNCSVRAASHMCSVVCFRLVFVLTSSVSRLLQADSQGQLDNFM